MFKIKMRASALSSALSKIDKTTETKTTIPILGCARIVALEGGNSVQICGTNLTMTLHTVAEAQIISPGIVAGSLKLLLPLVRSLSGDIEIEGMENHHLRVKSSSGKYRVSGHNPEMFPRLAQVPTDLKTLDAEILSEALDKTDLVITDRENSRWNFSCARLEWREGKLSCVGSDGYRMSVFEKECEGSPFVVFIPKATIPIIKDLCEGQKTIVMSENPANLSFAVGTEILMSSKIVASFPDWRSHLPQERTTSASVPSQVISDVLRRACTFADRDSVMVECGFHGDKLTFKSASAEKGECDDEVPTQVTGPESDVCFNAQYLLDFTSHVEGNFRWAVKSELDSCLLSSGPWSYIVMPIAKKKLAAAATVGSTAAPAQATSTPQPEPVGAR